MLDLKCPERTSDIEAIVGEVRPQIVSTVGYELIDGNYFGSPATHDLEQKGGCGDNGLHG